MLLSLLTVIRRVVARNRGSSLARPTNVLVHRGKLGSALIVDRISVARLNCVIAESASRLYLDFVCWVNDFTSGSSKR